MTTPIELGFLQREDGVRLAWAHRRGAGPTIVFLPGYASDMTGGKAVALDQWAGEQGRAMLRFDYSGCGASEGRFEDATLDSWRDDVLLLIDRLTEGPLVLVGSSMGGWLMLLVALARPERVKALVGIAPAPDFTDWGFTDDDKATLVRDGRLYEPSEYSDQPTLTTRAFWESGADKLLLGGIIAFDGPVRILQGQRDDAVPWEKALAPAAAIRGDDVAVTLIKDGDHRLSRPQDIALLIRTVADVA